MRNLFKKRNVITNIISLFAALVLTISLFSCTNASKTSENKQSDFPHSSSDFSDNSSSSSSGYLDPSIKTSVGYWREGNDFGCTWYWGDDNIEKQPKEDIKDEKDVVYPTVRQFMESTLADGAVILDDYYKDLKSFQVDNLDGQNLELSWESDGAEQFTVCIADNEYYKNSFVKTVKGTFLSCGVCIPGKTYYYKVFGQNGTNVVKEGALKAKDAAPRIIDIEGTHNVRDIGGYVTEDGKKVAYGLLYRGAELNGYKIGSKLSVDGKSVMKNTLGIKTEIDLRGSSDDGGQNACEFGGNYLKASIAQYYWLIPENATERIGGNTWYDGATKTHLQNIFTQLSDEDNYPFYFHCSAGADRTGTLAFLLNGLLGVSYDDLIRDWELTTFWYCYGASSIDDGTGGIGTMYRMLMQYYGTGDGKLSSAIENYLTGAMEIPQAQIDSFKSIMTGGVGTVTASPVTKADLKPYGDNSGVKLVQQMPIDDYDYLTKRFTVMVGALFIPSDLLTGTLDLDNDRDKILNVTADYPYKNAYKAGYEFRTSLSEIPTTFSGKISVVGYVTLTDTAGATKTFYTDLTEMTV